MGTAACGAVEGLSLRGFLSFSQQKRDLAFHVAAFLQRGEHVFGVSAHKLLMQLGDLARDDVRAPYGLWEFQYRT